MIEIQNIAMTGSSVSFTVPDNTTSLAIQIIGGDVQMRTAASGPFWTMTDATKEALNARTLSGKILYFTGGSGTTVQIRILTGLLS